MSIKKALATAMLLEKRKETTVEYLANNIAQAFELLANIEPEVALSVLNQLNTQLNEEATAELQASIEASIEKVAESLSISADELED